MSAAIAALIAALAVVYKLSVTTTVSRPIDTFLNILLDFFNGQSRVLAADEAMTVLLYSIVIYVVVFSASFFVLRFLAVFAAAIGIPDERQLRLNREARRGRGARVSLMRRQARLTALYTVRAQQAALAAQRKRQARAQATSDPTLKDFGLTGKT